MPDIPTLYVPESAGLNNQQIEVSVARIKRMRGYQDLSTAILTPTRRLIHPRVVQSWFTMMRPMNQKVSGPIFMVGMEIGDAYAVGFDMVLQGGGYVNRGAVDVNHIESYSKPCQFKYILTLEDDNMPPPDGLLKLIESIEGGVDGTKYDAVGGLYWTKGPGGQPMCYGDPNVQPRTFYPREIVNNALIPCNGLGMGFTLFRASMFLEGKIGRPFFKTLQKYYEGLGGTLKGQDLYFFERAGAAGYKFACDTRVKVGHHSAQDDVIW